MVEMSRGGDQERTTITIPVASVKSVPLDFNLGGSGIRAAVEWLWDEPKSSTWSEDLENMEEMAENVRCAMFSIERILQGLQLALSQAAAQSAYFPDLEVAIPQSAAADESLWTKMVCAACGAVRSVSTLQFRTLRVVQTDAAGVSSDVPVQVWDELGWWKQGLQDQQVRVSPLAEMALLLSVGRGLRA